MTDLGSSQAAIVTGGGRGIGAATATALAARGVGLALVARSPVELDEVAAALRGSVDVVTIAVDLREPGAAEHVVDVATARFGAVGILVNNAGMAASAPLPSMDDELITAMLDLNVGAVLRLSRAAAGAMVAQGGGRIVSISSMFGTVSRGGYAAYSASKAAVDALTKALAVELARHDISANAVAPGYVETRMTEGAIADARSHERMLRDTPMRRLGRPEEIAGVITYLALDAPSFLTGAVIPVDGGFLAR